LLRRQAQRWIFRRPPTRWLRVAAVVVAMLAVVVTPYFVVLASLFHSSPASGPLTSRQASRRPPSRPTCPSAGISDSHPLGSVAWIAAGRLTVLDVRSCRQVVLVPSDAQPPVRFSPDGRWLAYGDGRVVSIAGGAVQQPFQLAVSAWAWSPTEDILAGVAPSGGVLIAGPGTQARTLIPGGSGVRHLVFAPDGHRLAVDRAGTGIQVVDLRTGKTLTVFRQPDPARAPELAGWSQDGQWVLYWRGPVGGEAGALDAAPAGGGNWVNLFDPVLPYPDFISACGHSVALTAGAGQAVSVGKQVLLTDPPLWRFHNLTDDFTRSWIWPACSPDGRWLAAVAAANEGETSRSSAPRALWLLASDGSSRRRIVAGSLEAPELPRWSPDGRVLLVVLRSGAQWSSPGSLILVQVDPGSGRMVRKVGPIADIGPAPGPGGHQGWATVSDWYRPS